MLRSLSSGVDTRYVLEDQPGPLFAALDPARLFSAGPEALFVLRDARVECLTGRAIELVGRDPHRNPHPRFDPRLARTRR